MDDIDRACELEQQQRDDALRRQRRLAQGIAGVRTGLCADCGEPIAAARLAALPSAHLCIDCAQVQLARARLRRAGA